MENPINCVECNTGIFNTASGTTGSYQYRNIVGHFGIITNICKTNEVKSRNISFVLLVSIDLYVRMSV